MTPRALDYARVFSELPDAVIAADAEGRILAVSRAAECLLGYEHDGLAGESITSIMTPQLRAAYEARLRRVLAGDRSQDPDGDVLAGRVTRADGEAADIDLVLSSSGDPHEGILLLASLHDATERVSYQRQAGLSRYLRAGLDVTRAVASAASTTDAYKAVLPVLCRQLGCEVARLWMREPGGEEMVCVDYWYRTAPAQPVAASPFGVTCRRGEGLAGESWATGAALAVSVEEDERLFPNRQALIASGIRTAAAAPLEGADGIVGVLAVYFTSPLPPDGHSLDLLLVLGDAIGAALEAKQRDAAFQEQIRRHRLLLDASSAVASAGGWEATLRMLAASAVPGLADLCLIDLVTPDDGLERVAAVHADRSKAQIVEELKLRYPPEVGSRHPAGQVVATGQSSWSADMPADFLAATTRDRRHLEIVRSLGFESYLCVPLWAGDEVLGAITLISAGSGRAFGSDDLATAEELAQQVAGTVARARDLSLEHERTSELEARSSALVAFGSALAAASTVEQALAAVLDSPTCSLSAPVAWIALLDDTASALTTHLAGEVAPEFVDRYHTVSLESPLVTAAVVRTNRRQIWSDTATLDEQLNAAARDTSHTVRALAVEPLRAEDGTAVGALGLSWPEPRTFCDEDLSMLESVGTTLSRTVARVIVAEREHQIATSLQERMLALDMRSTAAVVAAQYQPASGEMRVGGDWYTTTAIDPSRRIGVSVGDVVGHGLAAVTTMGQLRSALGLSALSAEGPGAVIDLLDRYAGGVPDAACATIAYALVDAEAHTVEYACAGHPYPLLITAEGEVEWLQDGRRPPLAINHATEGTATGRSAFPPGATLVLYSDGLIERHGESLDDGMERLATAARACARLPAAQFCSEVRARLALEGGYADDVVIVAVRPVGTTADTFVDCLRAGYADIPLGRRRLRRWLEQVGMDGDTISRVLLGVGEAVNNAIEHGSQLDAQRTVSVEVFAEAGLLSACVSDHGHWSKDSAISRRGGERGRGLTLMHGMSDEVRIRRTPLGTQVLLRFRTEQAGSDEPLTRASAPQPVAG